MIILITEIIIIIILIIIWIIIWNIILGNEVVLALILGKFSWNLKIKGAK